MKKLKKDDIFKHLDQFLKDRGIGVIDEGPLGNRLKTGCRILTDAINQTQSSLDRARDGMDEGLDKMRAIIHQKTAPRDNEPSATKQTKAQTKRKKNVKKKAKKAAKKSSEKVAAKTKTKTKAKTKTPSKKKAATKKAKKRS